MPPPRPSASPASISLPPRRRLSRRVSSSPLPHPSASHADSFPPPASPPLPPRFSQVDCGAITMGSKQMGHYQVRRRPHRRFLGLLVAAPPTRRRRVPCLTPTSGRRHRWKHERGGDAVRENGRARDRRRWRVCQALVDDAVKKGARVLTGGFLPKGDDPLAAGSFYPPTVLVDVPEVRAPRVLARISRTSRVRRRGSRVRASGTAAAAGGAEPKERARLVCLQEERTPHVGAQTRLRVRRASSSRPRDTLAEPIVCSRARACARDTRPFSRKRNHATRPFAARSRLTSRRRRSSARSWSSSR